MSVTARVTTERRYIGCEPNPLATRRAILSTSARHHLTVDVDTLFDHWERAWSGRVPAAFEAVCSPEVHYEDPLTPEPLVGTRSLGRHAERLWLAPPGARADSPPGRPAPAGGAPAP